VGTLLIPLVARVSWPEGLHSGWLADWLGSHYGLAPLEGKPFGPRAHHRALCLARMGPLNGNQPACSLALLQPHLDRPFPLSQSPPPPSSGEARWPQISFGPRDPSWMGVNGSEAINSAQSKLSLGRATEGSPTW